MSGQHAGVLALFLLPVGLYLIFKGAKLRRLAIGLFLCVTFLGIHLGAFGPCVPGPGFLLFIEGIMFFAVALAIETSLLAKKAVHAFKARHG